MGGRCSRCLRSSRSSRLQSPSENLDNESTTYRVNLLKPENTPISIDLITTTSRAICSVKNNDGFIMKGVLVSVNGSILGLITHSNSRKLSECFINLEFIPPKTKEDVAPEVLSLALDTSRLFTFYCPIAEIIFIKLEEECVQQLNQNDCHFLALQDSMEKIENGSSLFLCNSANHEFIDIASGSFIEYYGLDLSHTVPRDFCTVGLPLMSCNGQLIGVQKPTQGPNTINSLAVSLHTVFTSHLSNLVPSNSVITNPIDMSSYETKLKEQGLEHCSMPNGKYSECNMYVSPGIPYVTPIWYIPTCVGWYWTPTDPEKEDESINWMPVTKLAVVGGRWNGEIPAKKNVKIIRWLSLNNIKCGETASL